MPISPLPSPSPPPARLINLFADTAAHQIQLNETATSPLILYKRRKIPRWKNNTKTKIETKDQV